MRLVTMELDFLANGGFVFPKSLCNSNLCGVITYAGLNNPAFFQGKGFVFVVSHRILNLLFCDFCISTIIIYKGLDTYKLVYGLVVFI